LAAAGKAFPKIGDDRTLRGIEHPEAVVRHPPRYLSVESMGNRSGDGCDGVAVTAEGNGFPDRVLEIRRIQKGNDGLGNGSIAAHVEHVFRPDFLNRAPKIVTKRRGNVVPD